MNEINIRPSYFVHYNNFALLICLVQHWSMLTYLAQFQTNDTAIRHARAGPYRRHTVSHATVFVGKFRRVYHGQ